MARMLQLLLPALMALSVALAAAPSSADFAATGVITVAELPREARATLALIKKGGPFPYRQDGVTFGNRERLLPLRARGYYREYTVITPRSRDRGGRRIIAGVAGEYYYTEDHYRSFKRIRE